MNNEDKLYILLKGQILIWKVLILIGISELLTGIWIFKH